MSCIGKNIRKIRAVKKMSQADFAAIFNLARPSVGAYEEGRAEPKIDTVIQMANHFGISINMLLTKEITVNELYHFDRYEPGAESEKFSETIRPLKKPEGIPFVASNILYEYISGRENSDFIAALPTIQLPQEQNRINRAFEINSNEMHYLQSGIKGGDIVNTIFKGNDLGNLVTGKVYFVISGGNCFVRRLRFTNKVLEFAADNPDFPEIRISLEEIDELWEVKGVYSENLEKSISIDTKIFDLEKTVQDLMARVKKLEGRD